MPAPENFVDESDQFLEWVWELQEPCDDEDPLGENWQALGHYPVFLVLDQRQCTIGDPQGYRDNERPLRAWIEQIASLCSGSGSRDAYLGLSRTAGPTWLPRAVFMDGGGWCSFVDLLQEVRTRPLMQEYWERCRALRFYDIAEWRHIVHCAILFFLG